MSGIITSKNNITNDKVINFIEGYYRPLDDELLRLREESEKNHIPIILRETENYLADFLRLLNPSELLEIGTATGYSALFMARLLSSARITTIDRDIRRLAIASENFKKFGANERISLLQGDAIKELKNLRKQGLTFDFAFIDASKSHYMEFFEETALIVKDGGYVICDNVLFRGRTVADEYDPSKKYKTSIRKMREFVDFIMENHCFEARLIATGDGLLIIRKKI